MFYFIVGQINQVSILTSRYIFNYCPYNGKQPMISNDKRYIITFNGEIFNYKSIRRTLIAKGYSFNTNSDTEVFWQLLIFSVFDAIF